jgi:sialate O-acetylesterase
MADVKLPAVFADHMVLQRERPCPVWGWATAGETITVQLADHRVETKANGDGAWMVELPGLTAGGPHELVVSGKNRIKIADVLIGEVWLCSGQSNMAMTVSRCRDFEKERAAADFPQIRMFSTARQSSPEPAAECQGSWQVCQAESVGGFSATAYFFGRELHRELNVPVGLINSSWGGTAIEAWTSAYAQQDLAKLDAIRAPWRTQIENYDPQKAAAQYEKNLAAWKERAARARKAGKRAPRRPAKPTDPRSNQNHPANLFNGMINPLIPYAIRGAIWYQGERNSRGETSKLYGLQLQTLIADWRHRFGGEPFPFLWVQLPNYQKPQSEIVETTGWVVVRDEMRKTLAVANTGMATTIDVGEANDIHPKNKQDVGKRLAFWALAKTYGQDRCPSGPLYSGHDRSKNTIVLRFEHGCGGLRTGKGGLVGFAIAGEDKRFVAAQARIDGDKVIVWSKDVADPVAVRYAWAPNPNANLYNDSGMPATPFRTDRWPLDVTGRR